MCLTGCDPGPEKAPVETPCVPAEEACNGADDDCDGRVDEDVGEPWYLDADGDGWGEERWTPSCGPLDGFAQQAGDCDDADAATNPGTEEVCGGGDEDCDGAVDERGAEDCTPSWTDADGDGLGAGDSTCLCEPGGATVDGDCDDADPDRGTDCSEGPIGAPDLVLHGTDAHDVAGWRLGRSAEGLIVSGGGQTTWLLPAPVDGSLADQAAATFSGGAFMTAGDLGGDGLDDLVFILPDDTTGDDRWVTYVFPAPFSGTIGLDGAAWTRVGPSAGYLGWHTAVVPGDVDGDGADDLLVGSPETATIDRVWRLDPSGDEVLFSGLDLGTRLVGPGDLDGDGLDDLVLGEADAAVHVFDGPALGAREAGDARATLPVELALLEPAGDVDGDGLPDVLVGTAGRVWVLAGPLASGEPATLAVAALGGEDDGDLTYPAASAADVDDDGFSDVLVGDLQRGGPGAAYLVHGPVSGTRDLAQADLRLYGETAEDFFGGAVVLWDGAAWIGARGVDDAAYEAGAVFGVVP